MKVKLFTGVINNQPGVNAHLFEDEINEWLAENLNIKISHVEASTAPYGTAAERYQALCLVFYEEAQADHEESE